MLRTIPRWHIVPIFEYSHSMMQEVRRVEEGLRFSWHNPNIYVSGHLSRTHLNQVFQSIWLGLRFKLHSWQSKLMLEETWVWMESSSWMPTMRMEAGCKLGNICRWTVSIYTHTVPCMMPSFCIFQHSILFICLFLRYKTPKNFFIEYMFRGIGSYHLPIY